ncbi:MAG: lysostaphin resistance A-like protein [Bacteroidales bacterium]
MKQRIFNYDNPMSYWRRSMMIAILFIAMLMLSLITTLIVHYLDKGLLYAQAISTVLLFGGTAVLYWLLFGKTKEITDILYQGFSWRWLLHGIVLFVLSVPIVNFVSVDNGQDQQLYDLVRDTSYCGLIKIIIVLAILPGVFEELFFRGLLQKFILQWSRSIPMGLIVTSIIFSLVHFDMDNFFVRLILGLLLGLLYQYSGRLWVSMLFHILNNTVASLQLWLIIRGDIESDNINPDWFFGVISLILVIFFIEYNECKNPLSIRNSILRMHNKQLEENLNDINNPHT